MYIFIDKKRTYIASLNILTENSCRMPVVVKWFFFQFEMIWKLYYQSSINKRQNHISIVWQNKCKKEIKTAVTIEPVKLINYTFRFQIQNTLSKISHDKKKRMKKNWYTPCTKTNWITEIDSICSPLIVIRDEFRVIPKNTRALVGETVTLECEPPKGTPEPQILWHKNGQTLDRARYLFHCKLEAVQYRSISSSVWITGL